MDHQDDEKIDLDLNLEQSNEGNSERPGESKFKHKDQDNNSNKTVQKSDKKSNLPKSQNIAPVRSNFSKNTNHIPLNDNNKKITPISSQRNIPKNKIGPNSFNYKPLSTNSLAINRNEIEPQKDHHLNTDDENNRHIENETLLSDEDTSSIPPDTSKKENHKNPKSDNPINNNQKVTTTDTQEDSDREDLDIQIEKPQNSPNKIERKLSDHSKSGFLNPPFQNLHDVDQGREVYRLSGMSPLKTVCYLSIGPLLNEIALAIESFVETIWISKAVGKYGMSAISLYSPFVGITQAFGLTASFAGSCAISAMIATNKTDKKEASQVIVDLLRVCLIVGIIIPCVLCPLVEKSIRWFGASEKVANLGFKYILPILICTFSTCMCLAVTGFLEGEGRPILYSLITISMSIANVAFLCPLFLLAFKTGIVGAGISKVLSRAIPCFVLLVFYFKGAFTFKPKLNQVLKKFSPLTMGALKACLSQGIANLINVIPAILVRKILGKMSVDDDDQYNSIMSGYHAVTRYFELFDRIVLGFAAGYLTVASYAYNKNDFKRWLFLTLHVNWICFAWCIFSTVLTFSIPKKLAEAFIKDKKYLLFAEPMIRIGNTLGFFSFVQYTVGHLLRSIKMGFMAAVIGTLVHVVGVCCFALILYNTNKKDIDRLMYSYPLANALNLVVAGAFIAYPCYKFYKEWKFKQENGLENNDVEDGKNVKDDVNDHPFPPVGNSHMNVMK
ncbi:hypothetical protein M9Y10_031644 [Tritrichomonas musculus]|uniref:MatE family protein n=1 Tax=Tritrichomonas musculus TaxID=1915356 RepID=A0ABR2H159_9EUKA